VKRQGFDVLVEQDPSLRSTELCYVYAIRPSQRVQSYTGPGARRAQTSLPAVDEEILTPKLRNNLTARLPNNMVPSALS